MPIANISAALTAPQITAITTAIATIKTNLPFLLNLTVEERMTLSKMGDDGYSYVTKALDYAAGNPGVLPAALNLSEAQRDLKLVNDLRPLKQQVVQLLEAMDDTMMQAGVEAKDFADKFYEIAKALAATNTPGLDAIVSDLGTFYEKAQTEQNNPPA